MLINFIGLTGTGKTTSNRIFLFFKKEKHLDVDLFFNKIYFIDNICFMKRKYKERIFRMIEKSIFFSFLKHKYLSLGGGFFLTCSSLYNFIKKKNIIFETKETLPLFCRKRGLYKIRKNKKIVHERFDLINFLSFKSI
ncbi:Shikimate kinase I [Candidatus Vidania fulgoroideae]|nr:Shikimate kinase I [Candidatus Vidania fulgoroideae]